MNKLFRYALLALGLLTLHPSALARDARREVKGTWFASGLYSLNLANHAYTYSRIGAMGGYIGNWGGYAKFDFALVGNRTPNISAGFTKRLTTFHSAAPQFSAPPALHLYFGLGYGTIEHGSYWMEHDHIYNPDGTAVCVPGTERTRRYWTESAGFLAETGVILRYRHLNFTLGYGITADLGGAFYGTGNSANHSIMIAVGYTF